MDRSGIQKVQKEITTMRHTGFDTARCIAMFYIIGINHLSEYTGHPIAAHPICVSLIWSALGVFTFLSGFFLGTKYEFETLAQLGIFYKKRLLRIYPLFVAASLLLMAIGLNQWPETWRGLLGISPFWLPQPHTLWYVATLLFMYLITPALVGPLKQSGCRFLLIAAAIALFDWRFHSVDPRLYYYILVYFCGIKAHSAMHWIGEMRLLWLLLPYGMLLLMLYTTGGGNRPMMLFTGYTGIVVLLNGCVLLSNQLKETAFPKWISFLSYGSMCAYLFHRAFFWFFLQIATPKRAFAIGIYLLLIAFPCCIWVSYYLQKGYDALLKRLAK